jgi:hypothetical protein
MPNDRTNAIPVACRVFFIIIFNDLYVVLYQYGDNTTG